MGHGWQRWWADAQLGLRAVFWRPVQRLTQPPGGERFRRNFFPEGLVPTTVADRRWLEAAGRCIGCGLCDAAAGPGPAPSALPATFSKASGDLVHLGRELAAYAPERLRQGEQLCPSAVPLLALHTFLVARRAEVLRDRDLIDG